MWESLHDCSASTSQEKKKKKRAAADRLTAQKCKEKKFLDNRSVINIDCS